MISVIFFHCEDFAVIISYSESESFEIQSVFSL